uniref:Sortilin n=1 Tax=Sinocyclocheilus rhinocerous TaxID=307959 RepID=A0A673I1J1_9TELE
MRGLGYFIALLFFPMAFGVDFLVEPRSYHAPRVYVKSPVAARNLIGTGSYADISRIHRHIQKRSADGGSDSCNGLDGFEPRLTSNTHNVSSLEAPMQPLGSVVLALTTFQMPIVFLRFGQSKLYRSENYGKSFEDVTELINNTFISTDYGIAIGPENSGKVILTGDASGGRGARIFHSRDFGKSFIHTELPFHPLMQIMYNPQNSDVLVAISATRDLWISKDFGATWAKIQEMVCVVKCLSFFFSDDKGMLVLRKSVDFGVNIKTVAERIYSFGIGGRFLFASVMDVIRAIHVSVDKGEMWNMAQLPPVSHEQFYSILAANDEMVFMHVDEPGDTGFGTIYVSDDRGTVYSKSLERHLYTTPGGETDFTNVTSLRGVFTTSVLAEDGSVQTVISFDQGGEWVPLKKPENSKCDSTAKDPEMCSLHIHASYSTSMKLNVPMLPLSEPNAVGLILAHGSVGDAISMLTPDVYVSDDGGYTWLQALKGPHHYTILDSGGLLVAVEHSEVKPIAEIKFSTDEGQCWHVYKFTQTPMFFTGLASEPGARSVNVSLWGYEDALISHWVTYTIDFKDLLTRNCDDYIEWLAHSDDISDPDDGCMMGYKEHFLRVKKDSVCWIGRDYIVTKQPTPCRCTLDDFLCDFGYYRKENSSQCIEQADLKGHDLEICIHGKKEQLQTSGYRKIPGDKCEGGEQPERKVIDLSKRCVSNLLEPRLLITDKSTSHTAPIIAIVITILLTGVVFGVLFVKKYVCGGRFLVHRYSVLQHNVEANGIDEPLDTDVAGAPKNDFHDDSDEVLIRTVSH